MANEVSERKSSVTVLVDPKEIMGFPEIQQEQVGLLDLPQKDPLGVIQWLARRHLLRNSRDCEECHIPMTRVKRNGVDGFAWKCRLCDVRITIRRGSFFERSHLKLSRALVILHGWSQDLPQKNIAEIAGIDQTNSIVCWCKFCRDVCSRHFDLNENLIGGFNDDGSSKVVEIDESCFCKEKHSRGAVRPGRWVFGGIERGSGKCFLVDLANRTQETFSEIIVKYVFDK